MTGTPSGRVAAGLSREQDASERHRGADKLDARGQQRTALASVFAAGALVALKLGTGLLTGSLGLVSAGIESSGDVVAAILTLFAVRLGGRPADKNHPYGHRRAETWPPWGKPRSSPAVASSWLWRRSDG